MRRRVNPIVFLERLLLAIGLIALGWYGYSHLEARLYQTAENRALDALLTERPTDSDSAPPPPIVMPASGTVVGRIEIPRLGVSTIIRAGTDARTLQLAVGHIPGTALPGQSGNIGLAAHRDTFFRRLKDIEPDDEIRLVTPESTSIYRVDRTNVVDPDDVWVLDPTPSPVLTLITCYPFNFVGSAPERFVVRARLHTNPDRTAAFRPFVPDRGSIMAASSQHR
jgi:sortase A